jgi:hypothetical protein
MIQQREKVAFLSPNEKNGMDRLGHTVAQTTLHKVARANTAVGVCPKNFLLLLLHKQHKYILARTPTKEFPALHYIVVLDSASMAVAYPFHAFMHKQ